MRTVWSTGTCTAIAVAILLMIGFTPQVAQPQTTVRIHPESPRVKLGQVTQIDLSIERVSGLYGAEIHLRFDPEVLEVVDADPNQEGIQLEPGTLPRPDYVVQNQADNVQGTIHYAATQLQPNKPGDGDLQSLRAEAAELLGVSEQQPPTSNPS